VPGRSPALRCAPLRAVLAAALLALGCGGGSTPLPPVDVSHVAPAAPGSALPAGWSRGPFMEIFVRAYRDSDGDGIGDLRGLSGKLDYLQDLGVTGIWLMPITPSEDRDHGYAVRSRATRPGTGSPPRPTCSSPGSRSSTTARRWGWRAARAWTATPRSARP
jgi:hypothetical protein